MQFIVRYWVEHPPVRFEDGQQEEAGWVDHSSHPPSRLGLHNAILSAEDRLSVLRSRHGSVPHGCDIFIESEGRRVMLNVVEAEELLGLMQEGSLSWETFESLLEVRPSSQEQVTSSAEHAREVAEYEGRTGQGRHHIDFDA